MVMTPGMLLNVGKKLKEACAARCRICAIHVPFQSIWLALRKGLQLLSSLLYYLSLSYLDRPSMGAEVGSFILSDFLFVFWDSKFFRVFLTYRFLLEKLKVMFPFTVTLCLNVS